MYDNSSFGAFGMPSSAVPTPETTAAMLHGGNVNFDAITSQAIQTAQTITPEIQAIIDRAREKQKHGQPLTLVEQQALALYARVAGAQSQARPVSEGMMRPEPPIDPEMEAPTGLAALLTPRNLAIGVGVALVIAYFASKKS